MAFEAGAVKAEAFLTGVVCTSEAGGAVLFWAKTVRVVVLAGVEALVVAMVVPF